MEHSAFESIPAPRRRILQAAALAAGCAAAPGSAWALLSGSARGFNAEQVRRAQSVLAFAEQQQGGNTCVLYQLRGGLQALGRTPPTPEAFRTAVGKLEDIADLGEAFRTMGLAGTYEGGLFGALSSRSLVSTADALRRVTDGVLDGHLVFVSLDPTILHAGAGSLPLSGGEHSSWSPLVGHTVRVTAIEGTESGTHFHIYDTAGAQRSYRVPLSTLFAAYDSRRVFGARGLFRSRERVFPPVQRPTAPT